MSADIVQRIDAFTSVADDDLPPGKGDGTHAALGNLGEGHDGLENRFAHLGRSSGCGSAHFNRDPMSKALNLCGALTDPHVGLRLQLDLDLRLEYRDRLADDPDAIDGAILDFELDVHTARPVQLMPLHAAE
jgi:hypothetical protein